MKRDVPKNRFCIGRPVLGRFAEIEITEGDYKLHLTARNFLSDMLEVERRFDLLVDNYLELQNSIHDSVGRYIVRFPNGEAGFDELTRPVHRTFFNFLAAARAFIDQIHLHTTTDKRAAMKLVMSAEYDAHLSYRVIEALRNFAQHRSFPLQSIAFSGNRVSG